MTSETMLLGDWGTSSLTLYKLGNGGHADAPQSIITGKGVKFCDEPEVHFHELLNKFPGAPSDRAFLSGMVGSSIGWINAPYASCPCDLSDIAEQSTSFQSRNVNVTITPGVQCVNSWGDPDVMRGEEVQVFGSFALDSSFAENDQLICLPGTHTKWVKTRNASILEFATIPRGEVWEVLSKYSVLLDKREVKREDIDWDLYEATLADVVGNRWPNAMSALFGVRAGVVTGAFDTISAASRLSGILVGFDVQSGLGAYGLNLDNSASIMVIGSEFNAALYSRALAAFDCKTTNFSSQEVTLAGLCALSQFET